MKKKQDLLGTYRKMRDFKATPEPKGKKPAKKSGFRYLIQKHDASHLHYDFRLEIDGVLKSWAVPKGPSNKPGDKRLAMQTEDHPLEYGTFEGTIPSGHYGGGTVMLWDEGTWEPLDNDFEGGKLKFLLHGEKLQGMWTLVKMRNKETQKSHPWLLIKDKDPKKLSTKEVDDAHSVVSHRTMEEIAAEATKSSKKASKIKGTTRAVDTKAPKAAASKYSSKPASKSSSKPAPKSASKAAVSKSPPEISPTLAMLSETVPEGDDWWIEMKYDGYRLMAHCFDGTVRLMTRGGKDWTKKFPTLAKALLPFAEHGAILDGELIAEDDNGISDFQKLQNSISSEDDSSLRYFLFDVPFCAGFDIRDEPLTQRRKVLEKLVSQAELHKKSVVDLSPIIEDANEDIMKEACKAGWEGIICKRKTSTYGDGKRTRDWIKVKCQLRQEFVIAGYTDPQGTRLQIGSLVLGYYKDGILKYAGHVGTGFTQQSLRELSKRFSTIKQSAIPFEDPISDPLGRKPHWLKPTLVAEVGFTGWTSDGRLRHPVFKGLRDDKPAQDIGRESPTNVSKPKPAKSKSTGKTSAKSKRVATTLSHPEKVLFSKAGVTKNDLALYFQRIAPLILPHIQDRPLSLMRCPDGDVGAHFYQKHASAGMPDTIHTHRVGDEEVLTIDSVQGLVGLVQIGCLEIHPWGASLKDVDTPDRLVFDLDPGEGVTWSKIVEGAKRIREILQKAGLESFVKTSGGKGLHVVAPLTGKVEWDFLKNFSHAVANLLAGENPKLYVATSKKSEREGRIYVDYLRNGRGSTHVAPYSTRANADATISMPLSWDELSGRVKPADFTVLTLAKHLKGRKDPWEKFFQIRQKIRIGLDALS